MALSKVGGNQIDTVNGDLTVDTDTLHVNAANNRVGIGTTSGARQLTVSNSGAALLLLESTGDDNGQLLFGDSADGTVGKVGYHHSTNHMFFNTNGSEQMRIDASGRVTISNQPSFQARSNISNLALSGYANTTTHLNAFNVEYFDIGNNYDTSTSTFTAPVAGRYYVYTQLQLTSNPATSDHSWGVNLHFQVNSAGNHANGYVSLSTGQGGGSTTLFGTYGLLVKENILNLSANDTVRVALSGNANINAGTIETATNDGRCRFGGHLLG